MVGWIVAVSASNVPLKIPKVCAGFAFHVLKCSMHYAWGAQKASDACRQLWAVVTVMKQLLATIQQQPFRPKDVHVHRCQYYPA